MSGAGATVDRARRWKAPGRAGRVLVAVAVAVAAVIAGVGLYTLVTNEPATLVIYTYPSLFGGSNCGAANWSTVFGEFESAHHVTVEVQCPAGNLESTLLAQANAPAADLVIGLDELTAPEAEAHHLLVPYTPPQLANVPSDLVAELSPDAGAVPYEWGYLAIDYSTAFSNATRGAVAHTTLPELAANATWARNLLIEDPSVDITGEEFLVWQIEYYTYVLHQPWPDFWRAALPNLPAPAPDWGTAFGEFAASPSSPQMVVSYATDPAYAQANGLGGQYNSSVAWWNGTAYGWRTIYGVGIVNGSRHLALDQEFEQWLLGGTVQALVPLNEWEYPANSTVELPPVFSAALNPATITPLNLETSPAATAASLTGWVDAWLALSTGTG